MPKRPCRRYFCVGTSRSRPFKGGPVWRPEAQSRIAEENDPERSEVQLADIKAGPDRLLLSREIEATQQAAMGELTPTERTAFVLRHMEDRSTEEIAAALNIAPNAAKQAVFRAVQKLRRQLAPLWVNT